jgi:hypothetical protein
MAFGSGILEEALKYLGQLLSDQGHYFEVVAIGAGGLLLLGLINRPTKDLDLVALVNEWEFVSADPLPLPLVQAIHEVEVALNLGKNWLNSGPADLLRLGLPDGFWKRMHTSYYNGLTVHLAAREDQICFKLYAAVEGPRSKHFADLKFLRPSQIELEKGEAWCMTQDVSEGFLNELTAALAALRG